MRGRGWQWPLAIIGLLLGSAGANIAFMLIASGDASFAVEKDYYLKALAWDETMAQQRRNADLGWKLAVGLEPAPDRAGQALVTARVTDRHGAPVEGARVIVEALHNARASQVVSATLEAGTGGEHAARLPISRPGLWELRVRVERAPEVFTATIARDLRTAP